MPGGSKTDQRPLFGCLIFVVASLVIANAIFVYWMFSTVQTELETLVETVEKLQSEVLDVKVHQSPQGEMMMVTDFLSKTDDQRVKRSELSPTSSSQLAVDVGSVFVSAIKQMCKPKGAVCIPGAKGEAGQPGTNELPGRDGRDGQLGSNGQPGRDGKPGGDGLPGATGRDGPPGKPEAKGLGLPGKQGPIGIPSVKGDKGDRSERGMKGHVGSEGRQGAKGIQGEKGERGDRGERGYPGYKGERGVGERGMTGEKGMKGDSGSNGTKGVKGETELPSPCHSYNHQILSDTWRKVSSHLSYRCDNSLQQGWYLFSPSIGGAMPETCPPIRHCGTSAPGWLNGSHPTAVGQTRKETVCFHWNHNCCTWQVTVDIINCRLYYVYNLPPSPRCHLAYCSNA